MGFQMFRSKTTIYEKLLRQKLAVWDVLFLEIMSPQKRLGKERDQTSVRLMAVVVFCLVQIFNR